MGPASIFILLSCICATAIGGNETDREALLEFKKKITHDPLGVMSTWNGTVHFCQWLGVICGRRHQRVTVLDLDARQLSGTIAPHIGNLSFLRVLQLGNNSFSLAIPSEIGRLRRLQILLLYYNSMSGQIPSNISHCSNLFELGLSHNQLIGEIPVDFGSLTKLNFINSGHNNLTGSIPASFGNLTSLEDLYMNHNYLDKPIPNSLGQLQNLRKLVLAENRLSGSIPSSIFNLSFLEIFDVPVNHITGSLPPNMGITLQNVKFFSVFDNQLLTGSIPVSISNASNLQVLQIGESKFFGKVPSLENLHELQKLGLSGNNLGNGGSDDDDLSFLCSLINATNLGYLACNRNNFGGVLPKCLGNLSSTLITLFLDYNAIDGGIPSEIGNLRNLVNLDLGYNKLSGPLPTDIGKLKQLVLLHMNQNKLFGEIPSSLGNLTSLLELNLSDNKLWGSIPLSLGNCQKLLFLGLSDNNLNGTIPSQVTSLSYLSKGLFLSRNHLTGSLPNEVGDLKNIGILDVSDNMLSGKIPSSLGSCTSLEMLDLSGNFFRGFIPLSLASLRGITYFNLARNKLSGKVPEFLEHFGSLLVLNLSYNNFEGTLPVEGVFENKSAVFVEGNSRLCGGIPELELPRCEPTHTHLKKSNFSLNLIFVIAAASGILALSLIFTFFLINRCRKKRNIPAVGNIQIPILSVSYQSLLKATNGFSSANLVGKGSFGSVYKGILNHDGAAVAIKVLNPLYRGAFKSFMTECEALRNIRHRNLVKILTACSGIDYQGGDFKALVYEFMANGSLEKWVHTVTSIEDKNAEAPLRYMGFLMRLNIAIDVASALEYLHLHCQPPIAHCDLKPSNILLDEEMTAHVGDFGLARILQEATSNVVSTNNNSSSIGLRGTIGYAPPEYGVGSEVSIHGDVYSYGILLLELFTGKRPTAHVFNESLTLRTFVKDSLPENVRAITDPTMLDAEEEITNTIRTEIAQVEVCLNFIFEIGLACSASTPRERKDMGAVVTELINLKNKFVRAGTSRT